MSKLEAVTVLLVEDDAIIALAEERMLQRNGFRVLKARTGENAVAVIESGQQVDIVLMDMDLGSGIDGTEAAQQILAQLELPIVFLTSYSEKECTRRVEQLTSYGYVMKSSAEFVLIEAIATARELFSARESELRAPNRPLGERHYR